MVNATWVEVATRVKEMNQNFSVRGEHCVTHHSFGDRCFVVLTASQYFLVVCCCCRSSAFLCKYCPVSE